jgi:hypothetical protein
MNTDGQNNIDSATNLAKRTGVHMLSLAENGATNRITGLSRLLEDRAPGGCTQASGKGGTEELRQHKRKEEAGAGS